MIFDPHILIPVAHAAEEAVAEGSTGVAGTLGINLKFFIAQLFNFAVILVILWKWVFTPVARKLTERTEKIEKSLNDADRIQKEKQEFEQWRNQEMTKARQEAGAVITAAQNEAAKVKQQILEETRLEQQKVTEQARIQIQQEKDQAIAGAKAELANIITAATEKVLRQKLDDKKDKELIKESLRSI